MSKKKHKKKRGKRKDPVESAETLAAPSLEEDPISSRGKKTIAGGIVLLILGFIVLTLTDPEGRNWASTLSPIMILGAYGIIAIGIFLPDDRPEPIVNAAATTTKEDPDASGPA